MNTTLNYSNRVSTCSSSTIASAKSSASNASDASSLSSLGYMPIRSSMKSNPVSPNSSAPKFNSRSSPPTVRFAETEPLPRSPTRSTPMSTIRSEPRPSTYTVPNPLLQHQHQNISHVSNTRPTMSDPRRHTMVAQPTLRPQSILITRPKRLSTQAASPRTSPPESVTTSTSASESRWSHTLRPTRISVPNLTSSSRVNSNATTATTRSTTSAPAALTKPSNPANPTTQTQYNPLQHYIPCLYPTCSTHYTAPHAGSMYYVPQGPYSLTRLHGYCPRHTTKELADASATCKREWETLRQTAGRKTLGQIAADFETFKKQFRDAREVEDAQLQRDLRNRVLGSSAAVAVDKKVAGNSTTKPRVMFDTWDWRYTPRHCTTANCKTSPYSPFASHLYTFYTTSRPSTFTPLSTLCPACANKEIEAFERRVSEKWGSRVGGWDEVEWEDWFGNVLRDREMEGEFWEKAQERVGRERGVRKGEGVVRGKGVVKGKDVDQGEKKADVGVGRRKSVFRRLFSGMSMGV